jgi:hypothetical protein
MHTMALDQSALLELLDAVKTAHAGEVVRRALERVFQALMMRRRPRGSARSRTSGPRIG